MKIKVKTALFTWILAIFVTVLWGCGSAETIENTEEKQTLQNIDTEEMAGNDSVEEIPERISLETVMWKDYDDGTVPTLLLFPFSDGTVVEVETPQSSIVKNVEYTDITGDGQDEIIVFADCVNTIHDNFISIYFFRIEDGMVTDISPAVDIRELEDEAWHTEVVEESEEGYTIVLEMESYGKTAGVLYIDCIMTVGYNGTDWEMIRKRKRPEWKQIYLDYLVTKTDIGDDWRFQLMYVDEDEIPELLCYNRDVQSEVFIFTCGNGEINEYTDRDAAKQYWEDEDGMTFDELWGILGSAEDEGKMRN